MKRLKWSDIPKPVLQKVYKKWAGALKTGWQERLWMECALCKFFHGKHLSCESCPAWKYNWCVNFGGKLHRYFHYSLMSKKAWRKNVIAFLKMLKRYL